MTVVGRFGGALATREAAAEADLAGKNSVAENTRALNTRALATAVLSSLAPAAATANSPWTHPLSCYGLLFHAHAAEKQWAKERIYSKYYVYENDPLEFT